MTRKGRVYSATERKSSAIERLKKEGFNVLDLFSSWDTSASATDLGVSALSALEDIVYTLLRIRTSKEEIGKILDEAINGREEERYLQPRKPTFPPLNKLKLKLREEHPPPPEEESDPKTPDSPAHRRTRRTSVHSSNPQTPQTDKQAGQSDSDTGGEDSGSGQGFGAGDSLRSGSARVSLRRRASRPLTRRFPKRRCRGLQQGVDTDNEASDSRVGSPNSTERSIEIARGTTDLFKPRVLFPKQRDDLSSLLDDSFDSPLRTTSLVPADSPFNRLSDDSFDSTAGDSFALPNYDSDYDSLTPPNEGSVGFRDSPNNKLLSPFDSDLLSAPEHPRGGGGGGGGGETAEGEKVAAVDAGDKAVGHQEIAYQPRTSFTVASNSNMITNTGQQHLPPSPVSSAGHNDWRTTLAPVISKAQGQHNRALKAYRLVLEAYKAALAAEQNAKVALDNVTSSSPIPESSYQTDSVESIQRQLEQLAQLEQGKKQMHAEAQKIWMNATNARVDMSNKLLLVKMRVEKGGKAMEEIKKLRDSGILSDDSEMEEDEA